MVLWGGQRRAAEGVRAERYTKRTVVCYRCTSQRSIGRNLVLVPQEPNTSQMNQCKEKKGH
jgi:hypothetical protein